MRCIKSIQRKVKNKKEKVQNLKLDMQRKLERKIFIQRILINKNRKGKNV